MRRRLANLSLYLIAPTPVPPTVGPSSRAQASLPYDLAATRRGVDTRSDGVDRRRARVSDDERDRSTPAWTAAPDGRAVKAQRSGDRLGRDPRDVGHGRG